MKQLYTKYLIILIPFIALAGVLLYTNFNNDPVIHLGINAKITQINFTEKIVEATYVDTITSNQFKFYVNCNDAIKQHQIIYCNYNTHEVLEISFDTLNIDDQIILSLTEDAFDNLEENAIVQALQIQLATQRLYHSLDINNLLEYSIDITDNVFSPKQVKFHMTVDEVLQIKALNSDAVSEDGPSGKQIINNVNVANLSHEMTELYTFHKDKLVSVAYTIAANDTEKTTICNSLYEQASKQLPAPTGNTLEDIKAGKNTVFWLDQEQNSIALSFPMTQDGEPNAIILSIDVSKTNK